jgi:hypothetical protein
MVAAALPLMHSRCWLVAVTLSLLPCEVMVAEAPAQVLCCLANEEGNDAVATGEEVVVVVEVVVVEVVALA